MPIKAVENVNCPVDQIDTLDFAVDALYMSHNFAHWIDDVSEIQVACGDFVQHRSEQEKIVLADHGDFKIGIAAFGGLLKRIYELATFPRKQFHEVQQVAPLLKVGSFAHSSLPANRSGKKLVFENSAPNLAPCRTRTRASSSAADHHRGAALSS